MKRRRPGARKAQDRGAALILVIWAIGLMAVIAALIARDSHLDALEGNRLRDALSGQMMIESGQRIALARLAQPADGIASGFPIVCTLPAGELIINVRPVNALIDLNSSPEETLAALFAALGVRGPDAATYAARIADYRDGDTAARPGGAEFADYQRAGLAHGPANRPFLRTGEISEVFGLPPALISAALPHLTAHSHTTQVDALYAAPEVLAAIEVFGTSEGTTLEDPAFTEAAEGAPAFSAEPVIIEVLARTTGGFQTGMAATFGPQDRNFSGRRRLVEERTAGPEPILAASADLPAAVPCY